MPFGLANTPATFKHLMKRVLNGLQWNMCLVYMDEVFSTTLDDHLQHMAQVFIWICAVGLKLKLSRCHLLQWCVYYLGHIVSEEGIHIKPAKTQAVDDWPSPRSLGDVRSFMRLCCYYQQFVSDFATLAKPLIRLIEKKATFRWTDTEEQAFNALKRKLMMAPILAYPDPKRPFILDTNTPDVGIRAVLSQDFDREEKVIAYDSRMLSKAEKHYCIT